MYVRGLKKVKKKKVLHEEKEKNYGNNNAEY